MAMTVLGNVMLKEQFSEITLMHMRQEVDLGDVVIRDGEQSAGIAALWLVQRFFWDHPVHKGINPPHKALVNALEQAKYMAADYLFNEWQGLGERAKIFLLQDAQRTGWHTSKLFNYHNLEEMLSSFLEGETTQVGISTWAFMVRELLPAAARFGIEPTLLYGASAQARKLRELIPVARKVLGDPTLSDRAKERYLKYFISHAADTTVSHSRFKRDADRVRERKQRKLEKLKGYETIMPNGETWVVVRCPRPFDERVVELLLGTKVDLRVTDWRAFTVLIAKMLEGYRTSGMDREINLIPRLISILEGNIDGNQEETSGTDLDLAGA